MILGQGAGFGVIADDFTGAMDTGAQFAVCGLPTRVSLDGRVSAGDAVVVITTDSREQPVEAARRRTGQAAQALRGRRLFKKIDSTLRGHVGVEALAVLAEGNYHKGVICPVVPAAGRVVRAGCLMIHGVPLHETALGKDPGWPANTSEVAARLGQASAQLGLDVVRGSEQVLIDQVWAAREALIIPDADTEDDLERVGRLVCQPGLLPCGALGLARAWLKAQGFHRVVQPAPRLDGRVFLGVCGSANPAARGLAAAIGEQLGACVLGVSWGRMDLVETAAAALERGQAVMLRLDLEGAEASRGLNAPQFLGELVQAVCRRRTPDGLLLVGGETARSVLRQGGVQGILVQGELAPGMAWGIMQGGDCPDRWMITQSGGLSDIHSADSVWAALAG